MSETPTDKSLWESGMSFDTSCCGSWLPTQRAYARFRGNMQTAHTCACGKTETHDRPLWRERSQIDAAGDAK